MLGSSFGILEVLLASYICISKYPLSDNVDFLVCSVGVSSVTQKIADLLDAAAEEAPDVRSYLETQRSLRRE